jgi:integrator complex subunit 11
MMLEDQLAERGFSAKEIRTSVERCKVLEARQTFTVKPGLEVTSYRAGHVLGAVMFHVRYRNASAIYTGDFNATPDRHLGAYEYCPVPPGAPPPDIVITESTYGTTTRGSQRSSEREFLDQVHSCLLKGGKVLVPTFAMGRVQEIVSLLESHWERMNLSFPIFLCTKEAASVAEIYQFYEGWGSSRVAPPGDADKKVDGIANSSHKFLFLREPTLREIEDPGPLVLLATSAMLVGGLSVRAFRFWAGDEKNAVVFPGHCVRGTLGHTLLTAKEKAEKGESIIVKMSNRTSIKDEVLVRCAVSTAPFSAHTDSKGILQLMHQLKPRNVVLVHGVRVQMEALRRRMERELPYLQGHVYFPENLEIVKMPSVLPSGQHSNQAHHHAIKRAKVQPVRLELLQRKREFSIKTSESEFTSIENFRSIIRSRFDEGIKSLTGNRDVIVKRCPCGLKFLDEDSAIEAIWGDATTITLYYYRLISTVTSAPLEQLNRRWHEIVESTAANASGNYAL